MGDLAGYNTKLKAAVDAIKKLGKAETADKAKAQLLIDADRFQKGLDSLVKDQTKLNKIIAGMKDFEKTRRTTGRSRGSRLRRPPIYRA